MIETQKLFASRTELDLLAEKYRPTKIIHDYFKYYWRHFAPIRHSVRNVLEIGVQQGRSLLLWKEYFPNARIHGIDIDPKCTGLEQERIRIFIGDSTRSRTAKDAVAAFGVDRFDIVIDDGAHHYESQIQTFLNFFGCLQENGVYVVEDVAQFPAYERLGALEAFAELIYGINYLPPNVHHWREATSFDPQINELVRTVCGVSFYRYIIFIDRGRNPESNRYLSDPKYNHLDIEAQAQQNGSQSDSAVPEETKPEWLRIIGRVLEMWRYRWGKQRLIGHPGKLSFLQVIWRKLISR